MTLDSGNIRIMRIFAVVLKVSMRQLGFLVYYVVDTLSFSEFLHLLFSAALYGCL